jgi:hypothetical protein
MNEPEDKLANSSELDELKEQCMGLRRQATVLLLGLIVLSFTLAFFVGFQVRRAGKDLDAVRPQARQMMEASPKEEPTITGFVTRLAEYGRTHQDFMPIMAKYGIGTNLAASKPNTNSAPAAPGSAR